MAANCKVWEVESGMELLFTFQPTRKDLVGGFLQRWPSDRHGQPRSDRHSLGRGQRQGADHAHGHTAQIHAAVFSPDGRRIVTGSADHTAKLWDAATGEELLTFKGHKDWIFSVAFSPDGQRIVTGSGDGTIKVWEAASEGAGCKMAGGGTNGLPRGASARQSAPVSSPLSD